MPYRICKTFEIESGHILSKHPGNCRFPHGHSRTVEVVLAAKGLDSKDMVCDFEAITGALRPFLDSWDHALCINTDDPEFAFYQRAYRARIIPFQKADPTSEVMAKAIYEELRRRLDEASQGSGSPYAMPPGVVVERVRVTETSSSWAEYSE